VQVVGYIFVVVFREEGGHCLDQRQVEVESLSCQGSLLYK
jgi:hypothetical protein